MPLDPRRIAQLIREDRQRRDETQEAYATGLRLTQTQVSKLELAKMPQMSADVMMALFSRFGDRLLDDEAAAGTARFPQSPSDRSTLVAPEGAVDDPKFQETWAALSELYRMKHRRKKRAAANWSHISYQIERLLTDAQREDGPLDPPADTAARRRAK